MTFKGHSTAWIAPFDRLHTSFCWHSIVTMALSCIISKIKRYIGLKLQFFLITYAFDVPVGVIHRNFAKVFITEKTRIWLPYAEESVMISLICWVVSYNTRRDRQMDRIAISISCINTAVWTCNKNWQNSWVIGIENLSPSRRRLCFCLDVFVVWFV